jgi:iron complex outermembrane receptor protein
MQAALPRGPAGKFDQPGGSMVNRKIIAVLSTLAGVSVAAAADSSASAPTAAQAPAVPEATAGTEQLQEIVITGSNIPTATITDVPVTVLGGKEIAQAGVDANLMDILQTRIPAFEGRSNTGNSNATSRNQFTGGGSQVTLRNLATLVLVNGRRLADSGINAAGGLSFVDVSQIPTAAIDHIEVLTDGASAIYGSDAVGGVVNIILKSNFSGVEAGGRYALATDTGHYAERSGYVVAGFGGQGLNLTVTANWSKTDPLWQSQRPFIAFDPKSGTSLPGYVSGNFLNPSLNSPSATNPTGTKATAPNIAALVANGTYLAAGSASIPPFNAASDETLLQSQTKKIGTAELNAVIVPDRLMLFGDGEISRTNAFDQDSNFLGNLAATGTTVSGQFPIAAVPAGSPFNPTTAALGGVVVQGLDAPVYNLFQTTGVRETLGLRGDISADWNWEVGETFNDNKTNMNIVNQLFAPDVNAAIAGGYDSSGNAVAGGAYSRVISQSSYTSGSPQLVLQPALDPFARAGRNPASLANVYGTEVIRTDSKLTSYDAKIVGTPLTLPGGKLGLAVGTNWFKEEIAGSPDQNSYNLSTSALNHNWGSSGIFFDPWNKSRTVDAYFGEVRAPITSESWPLPGFHALDLSLAYRREKYSDAGVSSSPKIGFRWQPFDHQVTLRGTYSKAFTAPDLFHEYGPPFATLTSGNSFLLNNVLSPAGTTNPAFQGLQYFSGNGNNPSLQPAYAWTHSVGVVLAPDILKGLTLDLEYVNVFQKGLPAGVGASVIIQSVNTLGSASPFFTQVALGALPGSPGASTAALASAYGLYNLIASGKYQGNLNVLDHFVNSGGTHEELLDFSAQYQLPPSSIGGLKISTSGTYLRSFQYAVLPNAPSYEYAGYSTNGQTESGTFPHLSVYTNVDWTYHNHWDLVVGNRTLSSMTDIPSGQIPAVYLQTHAPTTVGAYTTWDLQFSYTAGAATAHEIWKFLDGMTLTAGINNVFNRFGPLAPLSQAANLNNNNVDTATYSPIGRLVYVTGMLKF